MIPQETAEKLSKLILMLDAPSEGEILNAAGAIVRTLKGAELDLHALAALIESSIDRSRYPSSSGPQPSAAASWNFANHFPFGLSRDDAAKLPDAPACTFGLPLYSSNVIESWREVGRHCLKLNREIPKKHGGRSFRDDEIRFLQDLDKGIWPTNRTAEWAATMVARCHQARDAARRESAEREHS